MLATGKHDLTKQVEGRHLIGNYRRDFRLIQDRARKLLAERRGVAVDKVPWEYGRFHDIRGSWINWVMADPNVSDYETMKMCGHANIKTTQSHYLGVQPNLDQRVREALAS